MQQITYHFSSFILSFSFFSVVKYSFPLWSLVTTVAPIWTFGYFLILYQLCSYFLTLYQQCSYFVNKNCTSGFPPTRVAAAVFVYTTERLLPTASHLSGQWLFIFYPLFPTSWLPPSLPSRHACIIFERLLQRLQTTEATPEAAWLIWDLGPSTRRGPRLRVKAEDAMITMVMKLWSLLFRRLVSIKLN